MAGVAGVPEGEGPRLSPRTVDVPASRPPRSRAWTGAGACMPGQSGAGHGVQDPGPGRGEAAQSAILPGTARWLGRLFAYLDTVRIRQHALHRVASHR